MDTIALAQILGPVLAAAGIGFLLHPKFYKKIMKDFEAHQGLTYFAGILVMALGLMLVRNHNIWELSAAGIITVIGWGALIKGAVFLIAPNILFSTSKAILKSTVFIKVMMVVLLIAGIYLTWTGFGNHFGGELGHGFANMQNFR
ncbi:MAG: hypothetical protein V2A63_04960 [Patescibacteria group bacterium]